MPNDYFQFQQFRVEQGKAAMKVCTDACIFGAWIAQLIGQEKGRLLDIGTGTGLLALMVGQGTSMQIDAIDIDAEAVEQARDNFLSSPWSERFRCMQADVRTWHTEEPYDVIITNPPFYENDLRSPDARRNDALHSERLTLEELLKVVSWLLKPGGGWGILLPNSRVEYFLGLAKGAGWEVLHRLDVFNEGKKEPFRSCLWLGKGGEPSITQWLTIQQSGFYTQEFRQLLASYYLAFQAEVP
ncbi:MAG: tRNA1(Val) (adenine(37)-N6)-methyltransferase [Bacteroidota bacterium]